MKSLPLLFIIICSATAAFAQHIRLNAYGNYVFDDRVEAYNTSTNYFQGTIEGGLLWGAGIEVQVHEYYAIEVLYLRQDTKAPVHFYDINSFSDKNATLDVGIDWIMAGGMRALSPDKTKIEPYAGCMMGVALINTENPDKNTTASATKFAWGLRVGCNFWLSDRLAVKVQTQLLSAVQASGGTLYFGTGGAGTSVTGYSSMTQFSLGGGLVLQFGSPTPRHKK
jgi:hypothetical protein